ncbi:MAG: hypothetical protein ACTMIR_15665, partial [Cellulomonadaceae bacterium]
MTHPLRAARQVYASRSARRSRGDLAYVLYVSELVAAIWGPVLVGGVVRALSTPAVVGHLTSAHAVPVLAGTTAALALAAVAGGRLRGPVLPHPFEAWALGAGPVPRSRALRRPFARSLGLVIAVAAAATALVCAALLRAGAAGSVPWSFGLGVVCAAVVVTVLWLLGQAVTRRTAGAVTAVIVLSGGASLRWPAAGPAGWLALLWPAGHSPDAGWLAPLGAVAVLALGAVPWLLARVPGTVLERQSGRWARSGELARTGDLAGALDTFRARPWALRHRSLRITRASWVAWWLRDLLGTVRTPLRAAVAAVTIPLAGAVLAAADAAGGMRWAVAVLGAVLMYLGVGAWCDGLRHAAQQTGTTALYGTRPWGQALRHASLLLTVAGPLTAAGGGAWAASQGALSQPALPGAVLWPAGVAALAVTVRMVDVAKGPLPVELLMPVPTPAGDVSGLNVALWQADALIGLALAAGLLGRTAPGTATGLWWAVVVAGALALARRRFTRAEQPVYADPPTGPEDA